MLLLLLYTCNKCMNRVDAVLGFFRTSHPHEDVGKPPPVATYSLFSAQTHDAINVSISLATNVCTPPSSAAAVAATSVLVVQLRETEPTLAHFVSLGTAAQKLLNKSGYAYGSLVRITHSDRDREVRPSSVHD